MRKPRDYDAELKALADKARTLKHRQREQLGELVQTTGADVLDIDELACVLLAAIGACQATRKEWRDAGAAFFRGERRGAAPGASGDGKGRASGDGGAQPTDAGAGAA